MDRLMQIPTWAECLIWEFWSFPMSILDDPLDVAFAIGVYTNLDGGSRRQKVIVQQIQIHKDRQQCMCFGTE
jgi:hypothetical protein